MKYFRYQDAPKADRHAVTNGVQERPMDSIDTNGHYIGEFWLPNQAGVKYGGMLKVDAGHTSLELLGYFGTEPEVILGTTNKLGAVTLCDCHATNFPVPDDYPWPTGDWWGTYSASYVFVGSHLKDGFDSRFKEVEVELPLIDVWADLSRESLIDPVTGHEREPRVICRSQATDFQCVVFNYVTSSGGIRGFQREETYRSVSKFVLTMEHETPLSALHDRAYQLRDFLSLMMGSPCKITKITFNNPFEFDDRGFVISHSASLSVDEDYGTSATNTVLFRQLMPLSEFGERFEDVLTRWLALTQRINLQAWLFFSGSYNLRNYSPYSGHRLVALVNGLESLHRTLVNGGSKKYLRKRLSELFDRAGPVVHGLTRDREAFIHRCVTTRDFFSHYNDERATDKFKHSEHYAAILLLSMLMESLLLIELGFDAEHVDRRVRASQKFQDLEFQRRHYEISF